MQQQVIDLLQHKGVCNFTLNMLAKVMVTYPHSHSTDLCSRKTQLHESMHMQDQLLLVGHQMHRPEVALLWVWGVVGMILSPHEVMEFLNNRFDPRLLRDLFKCS